MKRNFSVSRIMGSQETEPPFLFTQNLARSHDSSEYPNWLGMFGAFWVIRCRSERKWDVDGKALTAVEWACSKKGFYSFKFVDKEGAKVNVKATSAKATHPDVLRGAPYGSSRSISRANRCPGCT